VPVLQHNNNILVDRYPDSYHLATFQNLMLWAVIIQARVVGIGLSSGQQMELLGLLGGISGVESGQGKVACLVAWCTDSMVCWLGRSYRCCRNNVLDERALRKDRRAGKVSSLIEQTSCNGGRCNQRLWCRVQWQYVKMLHPIVFVFEQSCMIVESSRSHYI
jgi:hypothetical protein